MNYIFRMMRPWKFISAFVEYARTVNAFLQARRESYWFEILYSFIQHEKNNLNCEALDKNLVYDLLRYDFVRAGKKGNFPSWYKHNYDKDRHRKLLDENGLLRNSRIGFAMTEYEEFDYNVLAEKPEDEKQYTQLLIKYDII